MGVNHFEGTMVWCTGCKSVVWVWLDETHEDVHKDLASATCPVCERTGRFDSYALQRTIAYLGATPLACLRQVADANDLKWAPTESRRPDLEPAVEASV